MTTPDPDLCPTCGRAMRRKAKKPMARAACPLCGRDVAVSPEGVPVGHQAPFGTPSLFRDEYGWCAHSGYGPTAPLILRLLAEKAADR